MPPLISVLMPCYNAEPYLREAIDSVLNQTFQDFELIIINDGSSDNSEKIIASYQDKRIRYLRNEKNIGLIKTLNKGINFLKGKYVTRMDADDVIEPTLYEKQVAYLQQNPQVTAVFSWFDIINDKGEKLGHQLLDKSTISPTEIKNCLKKINCLAHDSLMMPVEILKKYKYNVLYKHFEDYGLWLEMVADGYQIAKIPEILLHVRKIDTSVTQVHGQVEDFEAVIIKARTIYLKHRFFDKKQIKRFDIAVLGQLILQKTKRTVRPIKNMVLGVLGKNTKIILDEYGNTKQLA